MTSSSASDSAAGCTPSIEALASSDRPFVLADADGRVLSINAAFRRVYGWTDEQLVGTSLSQILPESFRMSHQLGFSRYLATEQSTILAHPLQLATICADGTSIVSEHLIVAERTGESWVFGATLTPLEQLDPSLPPAA
jgi:PAS domain S-box-containing protein